MSTTYNETKLGDKASNPETALDWCGKPYKPTAGEGYGGKPEHLSASDKMRIAREAKKPITEEVRERMRASMAHARATLARRRKGKAKPPRKVVATEAIGEAGRPPPGPTTPAAQELGETTSPTDESGAGGL